MRMRIRNVRTYVQTPPYIYIARLIIEHPREWLASLANYIPPPLTVYFSMTHSVRYQPILHTLYYTLHTEHAYCLSYRFLNSVVVTTFIEMVEILDGRLGKRSVERVRYVINNLLHLVIVKYGVISLVLYSARDNTVTTRERSRHISR